VRNFGCAQLGRFQIKTDIEWQAGPADSVENDLGRGPKRDIFARSPESHPRSHLVNAFVILKPMLFELSLEKFRTALLYVTVSLLP